MTDYEQMGVYVVKLLTGEVKIGATRRLDRRLNVLTYNERYVPVKSRVLVHWISSPIAPWIERVLHASLAEKRIHGEWYRLSEDDLAALPRLIVDIQNAATEESASVKFTRQLQPILQWRRRHNIPRPSDAIGGFPGVTWSRRMGKWEAQLHWKVDGARKKKHLGYFPNERDAAEAYKSARQKQTAMAL
jgi:hypothetical protein